jgi:cytochrome c-type biogenesis protein CcmH/NrfG
MNFLQKLFAPAAPRDYPAELAALNAKIEAHPGNIADYDARAGVHYAMGNMKASIEDFDRATSLEPDRELKELRMLELQEMIKKHGGG